MLRDGDTGYAKPGALRDGLHLAAYRPPWQPWSRSYAGRERCVQSAHGVGCRATACAGPPDAIVLSLRPWL